ncbi:MAG: hypothetical protein QXM16_02505, partial [Nitrososphaerota archaeon]
CLRPRKEVYKPLGRVGRRFYVDVHASANGRGGARPHIVFDGDKCVRMARLVDIPAVEGDEVYVDVIPPTMYEDVSALLRRGVRVFRLRRTDLIAAYRDRLSLPKNDENDAKLLSMLDRDCFVEVIVECVELMKLIAEYHKQLNILKLLRQLEAPAEAINIIRRNKIKLARQIISMANISISRYRNLCEVLKLSDNCLYGKVALADILLHVDFTTKLRRIICYIGLYRPNNGKYNHRLKQAANSLAISYYRKNRIKAREVRELLKKIKNYVRAGGPA